jgi:DNA-binding PadR family transcriptional regulator
MTVRLGLLAILDQGACYGYQLRSELDRRTGGTGPVNVGQIYNTLDRLERDKLVRKAGDTGYYAITDAGRQAVRDWFENPSAWDEFPAKLALASTLPGVDAEAIIRVQRAATLAELEVQPAPTDQSRALILAAGQETAAAEVRFLDRAERMLANGAIPQPLSSDVPKRGRPAKATAP